MKERRKMENVIKQLKQFKIDTIYEKKKHYNAAERKRKYYKLVSVGQIFLNTITGTTLLTVVFGNGSKVAEVLALVFTIVATILASLQKVWNFEKQAQGNAKVGDMYLRISKKTNLTLCMVKDGVLSDKEIAKRAEEIRKEISQANELGSQFPTISKDYKEAQEGIQNGEENYTDRELEIWE